MPNFHTSARLTFALPMLFACATTAGQVAPKPNDANFYDGMGDHVKRDTEARDPSAIEIALSLRRIERFLENHGTNVTAPRPGVWQLAVDGIIVVLMIEPERVRIFTPIFSLDQLDTAPAIRHALLQRLLQANFEQAADARYAVFRGVVFAAVTYPRLIVSESELDRSIRQVVNLHKNTFRNGANGYSARSPEPDSVEIDPRKDESLEVPEGYRSEHPEPHFERGIEPVVAL